MREVKRLILAVMALTFLAGVGTGTWIQSLRAASDEPVASVDRRVQDFERHFELTARQERVLRGILHDYDRTAAQIKSEITGEQMRKLNDLQEASRDRIRLMLEGPQRAEYDRLIGRR